MAIQTEAMKRIGIVCSTAGGAFIESLRILSATGVHPPCFVVTDRACGVEEQCRALGIPVLRVEDQSRVGFSQKAAHWFYEINAADWICLFFDRLVSSDLYDRGVCMNIHPSLLPSFPGLGGLKQAWASQTLFIGATAHLTDQSIDGGPIVAQVCAPLERQGTYRQAERISFAQKVYLFLLLWEMAEANELPKMATTTSLQGRPVHAWANPGLRSESLENAFQQFLKKENIAWIRQ